MGTGLAKGAIDPTELTRGEKRMNYVKTSAALILSALYGLAGCGEDPSEGPDESVGSAAEALTTSADQGGGQFLTPSGLCLQASSSPVAEGPVLVGSCSTNAATFALGVSSRNEIEDGSQGTVKVGGLCLEADLNARTVRLSRCNNSVAQEWTWAFDGLSPATQHGLCVTGRDTSGSQVALAGCGESSLNQALVPAFFPMMYVSSIPASSTVHGPHPAYNPPHIPQAAVSNPQCMDVFLDLETVANWPMDNFQCNATNAQWLSFNRNHELRTPEGTCVGATSGSANATVVVQTCNGSALQKWAYQRTGLMVNLGVGLWLPTFCMAVSGGSNASTAPLVLSNCAYSNTPPGQVWTANLIWPQVEKLTFQSKYFDVSEENGQATYTVYSNGNFAYSGNVHDAGFLSDFYAMSVTPTNPPGGVHRPLIVASGEVFGTSALIGSRDSDWSVTGFDPDVAWAFPAMKRDGVTFNLHIAGAIGTDIAWITPEVVVAVVTVAACVANGVTVSAVKQDDPTSINNSSSSSAAVSISCNL
ncbi:MAG: ricin-type beta-trefoil lectin domain protein [Myxococcales bacterium]